MAQPRNTEQFTVGRGDDGQRLDKAIRGAYPEWGRSAVGRLIQNRQVRINGKQIWLGSWKVHAGDQIEISAPPENKPQAPKRFDPAWLLADEGDVLVVCKPAGLLSQPTRAGGSDDLLSLAQAAFGQELRLFHRLDRDTSGLCLLTQPGPVNAYLDAAFKQRKVVKEYIALTAKRGKLAGSGQLRSYLEQDARRSDLMRTVEKGGQFAFTEYRVESETSNGLRVRLYPHTGRTHQLRVQLSEQGAPIIGDVLYGGKPAERLMLHAARIALPEGTGYQACEWICPTPF